MQEPLALFVGRAKASAKARGWNGAARHTKCCFENQSSRRNLDGDDSLGGEFLTSSICLSVKGRTSWRDKKNAPIISLLFNNGTPRSVCKPPSVTAVTATGSSCLVYTSSVLTSLI